MADMKKVYGDPIIINLYPKIFTPLGRGQQVSNPKHLTMGSDSCRSSTQKLLYNEKPWNQFLNGVRGDGQIKSHAWFYYMP